MRRGRPSTREQSNGLGDTTNSPSGRHVTPKPRCTSRMQWQTGVRPLRGRSAGARRRPGPRRERTLGQAGSPRLCAWLFAAEAEMCAHAGMPDGCRRVLDAATASIPSGSEDRDPDMLSIFVKNGADLTRWRGNVLAPLDDQDAVTSLYDALEVADLPPRSSPASVRAAISPPPDAREGVCRGWGGRLRGFTEPLWCEARITWPQRRALPGRSIDCPKRRKLTGP